MTVSTDASKTGLFNPASAAITGDTLRGVYNANPQNLKNFRKAIASVYGGAGSGRILCIGDSTTVGTGSVAGGIGAGVKNFSYPTRLASLLTNAGFTSTVHSAFGTFGYGASAPTYDPRISVGSWTLSNGVVGLGGDSFTATAATASPLAFTPGVNTDTCEIYYATGAATGSFNANINGGANTLTATNVGNGVAKVTLTGALGANTYNCTWASGGGVFIFGWIAYDSTQKQITVVNSGQGSARAATLGTNPWQGPAAHIARIAPHLTILEVGINNWIDQTALASFTADVQTLITAAVATGDLLMVSPIASNPATYTDVSQAPYRNAIAQLALSNGVPYLDLNARWSSYAISNGLGYYYTDGIHPTALAYADEARAIRNMLLMES